MRTLPRLAALAAVALLARCEPATQHDPDRYGRVTVFLASDWLPVDRPRLREALANLARLGPAFVETEFASSADVVLRPFASPGCALAGRHTVGTRIAEVDPACTPGDTAFRTAVAHEVGHVLGMAHVCRREAEAADCSPVGYGSAVMNPYLWEQKDPLDPVPFTDRPTDLDLAEFRRVRRTDVGR